MKVAGTRRFAPTEFIYPNGKLSNKSSKSAVVLIAGGIIV